MSRNASEPLPYRERPCTGDTATHRTSLHRLIVDHDSTLGDGNFNFATGTLGVEWQPVRKGIAEIEGFADRHLREFSTRRAEILEAAGGAEASARVRQVANLATRATKQDSGLSTQTLRERWGPRCAGRAGWS